MVKSNKPEHQTPEAQEALRDLEEQCRIRGIADESGAVQYGTGKSKYLANEHAKSARLAMKAEYKERLEELVSRTRATMSKFGNDRDTQNQQALATLHSMIGGSLLLAMRLEKSAQTLDLMLNSDTKMVSDSNREHFRGKLMGINHACAECQMLFEAIDETMETIK